MHALVTVGERQQTPYPARAWNPVAVRLHVDSLFFLVKALLEPTRGGRGNGAQGLQQNERWCRREREEEDQTRDVQEAHEERRWWRRWARGGSRGRKISETRFIDRPRGRRVARGDTLLDPSVAPDGLLIAERRGAQPRELLLDMRSVIVPP